MREYWVNVYKDDAGNYRYGRAWSFRMSLSKALAKYDKKRIAYRIHVKMKEITYGPTGLKGYMKNDQLAAECLCWAEGGQVK